MGERTYHVLFLCTGNSARSILAQAILARLGAGRFHAHSAGSHPKGRVHPAALAVLREQGHDTTGLRSKSWDELARPGAPRLDFVFTVCAAAAGGDPPSGVASPLDERAWPRTIGSEPREGDPRAGAVWRRPWRLLGRWRWPRL